MFLRYESVKKKQPKVENSQYLNHELEPKRLRTYKIAPEIEEELLANRYFLKRRVWKNMNKIRRSDARVNSKPFSKRAHYSPC